MNITCKHCGFDVLESFYYCPNCGKKLKNPPLSLGIGRQLYVYTISIILPPFGLVPAIRYLLDKRPKAKVIGVIAIVLTIVSIVITLQFAVNILNIQKDIASQQLKTLENIGY